MSISQITIDIIKENAYKFSEELQTSTQKLISLTLEYSPLSDIKFLMTKGNEELPGIVISTVDTSWVPIRNVIRIVGKIADSSSLEMDRVQEIEIHSMFSGCDYFKGTLTITSETGKQNLGEYKWQWSSFPGYDKNYNKFTSFPQNWVNSVITINKITI